MDGLKKDKKVMPQMLYASYRQFRMIEAQSENWREAKNWRCALSDTSGAPLTHIGSYQSIKQAQRLVWMDGSTKKRKASWTSGAP